MIDVRLPEHLTRPPSGDIILWSKPSCVQCTAVKRRLTEAGVPFTERDLTDPENASDLEYFQGLGYRQAPITEHGASAVPEYVPAEIDRIIAAWRGRRDDCRECTEGKHGACNGIALVDEGLDVLQVDCICASQNHGGA
jgi:glutaredoxin-like protein NrdH